MRYIICLALILVHSSTDIVAIEAPHRESKPKPNIVLMLADDQSWNGLSVAMHPSFENSKSQLVETPNLERMARQGMRFSAAYSPASVCSPTRLSLANGRSPAANHWTKAARSLTQADNPKLIPPTNIKSIPSDNQTIAETLKSAGYRTAHFGKWHIQGGGPENHGFDVSDGNLGNEHAFKFSDPNPVDIFGMCRRASDFMKQCEAENRPFFIQLSWHALHAPENASKTNLSKYRKVARNEKQAGTLALTEDLDDGVGQILQSLRKLELLENTYVIYTSDNGGGGGKRGGLSGGKGSVWEGGIRVPLIVCGPGIQPNSWCHETTVGYDFYPTFCEWAGVQNIPHSQQLEGGSIVSLLKNEGKGQVMRPRSQLVFHFPHYQSDDGPHSAIIVDDFKLIHFYESGRSALFNLSEDLAERNDLSKSRAKRASQLKSQLDQYLVEINAQMPTVNPTYDPGLPTKLDRPRVPRDRQPKRGGAGQKKRNNR